VTSATRQELTDGAVRSARQAIEYCYEQGWTDGLPVVPPLQEFVDEFLAQTDRGSDEMLMAVQHLDRACTVRQAAINAVMAGCRPEYFPAVLALVEAVSAMKPFVHPVNASTGGAAVGFVVNGPIRHQIGMNFQGNVLGPGNRANSTIGRALRLTQINAMGSVPGAGNDPAGERVPARPILDRSTIGQPGKYAGYHLAEYEEAFPSLVPLHVTLGFTPEQNVVSAFTVVEHIQISAHAEATATEMIDTICYYLVGSGRLSRHGHCVLVIPPESAAVLVRDGYTKADIENAVFEGTTRTAAWVKRSGGSVSAGLMDRKGGEITPEDETMKLAIAASERDVHTVVAGGPAGSFIYALLPYGGGFESAEIRKGT
jgi:hypothetical protein